MIPKATGVVTGAEGYIGTFLTSFLRSHGFTIYGLTSRAGEFEGMAEKILLTEWKPDYGRSENNIKSGVTAIGVRDFLIAYNIGVIRLKNNGM
mgnify:CR=1 FL=1